jgi:hypothetical protein
MIHNAVGEVILEGGGEEKKKKQKLSVITKVNNLQEG